jgi:hypothetical protein
MLISAVHTCAPICKLAYNLRVDKHALLPLIALREKLALLSRMQVLTRLSRLVTVWEVAAPSCLLRRNINFLHVMRVRLRLLLSMNRLLLL